MSAALTLGDDEVVELAEMLEFLHDWTSCENDPLGSSLERFSPGFSLDELRGDLARFAFLLGGLCAPLDAGDQP